MNQRSTKTCLWLEILTTSWLLGLSALIGMLAIEYLVTGSFDAVKVYILIALVMSGGLTVLQWYRYRTRHHPCEKQLPTDPHPRS